MTERTPARVEAAYEPGQLAREVWIAWAERQPDAHLHTSWLTAWDELDARDREVDALIEAAIREDEAAKHRAEIERLTGDVSLRWATVLEHYRGDAEAASTFIEYAVAACNQRMMAAERALAEERKAVSALVDAVWRSGDSCSVCKYVVTDWVGRSEQDHAPGCPVPAALAAYEAAKK